MNMISKKITLDFCIYFSVVNVGQTHIYKPLLVDKNNFRLLCLINNFTASHDFCGLLLKIKVALIAENMDKDQTAPKESSLIGVCSVCFHHKL